MESSRNMMTNNSSNQGLDRTEPYLPTSYTSSSSSSSSSLSLVPTPPSGSSYLYEKASQNPRKKRTKLVEITRGESGIGKPPKYYKKPDPLAPKITEPCTECGKTFWSWKALFGHMRCHPERQWRGINPPPSHRRLPTKVPDAAAAASSSTIQLEKEHNFLCGKEAVVETSQVEYEVAASLLILASGEFLGRGGVRSANATLHDHDHQVGHELEEVAGRFECSSCKKVFGSHQALGGHRASHKNVKGCFAITRTDCDHGCTISSADHASGSRNSGSASTDGKESLEEGNGKLVMVGMGHQCGVCFKMFSSGQALGGHMRCHWERAGEWGGPLTVVNQFLKATSALLPDQEEPDARGLDLNLPAPMEDGLALDLKLGL